MIAGEALSHNGGTTVIVDSNCSDNNEVYICAYYHTIISISYTVVLVIIKYFMEQVMVMVSYFSHYLVGLHSIN